MENGDRSTLHPAPIAHRLARKQIQLAVGSCQLASPESTPPPRQEASACGGNTEKRRFCPLSPVPFALRGFLPNHIYWDEGKHSDDSATTGFIVRIPPPPLGAAVWRWWKKERGTEGVNSGSGRGNSSAHLCIHASAHLYIYTFTHSHIEPAHYLSILFRYFSSIV